jgi:hypothetical protein
MDSTTSRAADRGLTGNHSRATARGLSTNHSRAAARGLGSNHFRATVWFVHPSPCRPVPAAGRA